MSRDYFVLLDGRVHVLIGGMRFGQVWPDGLGGFSDESQRAIRATQAAARTLLPDAYR